MQEHGEFTSHDGFYDSQNNKGIKMKKIIAVLLIMIATSPYAATKCERNYDGSICCWDTNTEGPFKPINC